MRLGTRKLRRVCRFLSHATTSHVRFRTDNLHSPLGTNRLAGRFYARRLVAVPHTCGREPGGNRRCRGPTGSGSLPRLTAGLSHGANAEGDMGEVCVARGLSFLGRLFIRLYRGVIRAQVGIQES